MPFTVNVFQGIGGTIDNAMAALVGTLSERLIQVITPWAIAGVILYFILYGYLLMVGKVQAPFFDFLMQCIKILVVGGVALHTDRYLTWIVEGFRSLENALIGVLSNTHIGMTIYASLDATLDTGWGVIKECLQMAGSAGWAHMGAALVWGINAALLFIGFGLAVVVGGVSIVVSHAMIKIAFAVGPLFIVCIIWPATARFFDAWMHFVLNHILIVVFTSAMLAISVEVYAHQMAQVKMQDPYQNVTRVSCELLIIAIVLHALMKGAIAMAVKLAGGFSAEFFQAMRTTENTMRGMQWTASKAWSATHSMGKWTSSGIAAGVGSLKNYFSSNMHAGSIGSAGHTAAGRDRPAYRQATLDYLQRHSGPNGTNY